MATSDMKKQLAGIDLMKYIMAYAVVAIHFRTNFNPDWSYPSIIAWFIRLAVPFFFITSGYLLQRKFNDESPSNCSKIAMRRALQVLKIWICWIVISFPMALYSYIIRVSSFFDLVKTFAKNLLIYGWESHAAPLWFLYSMFWVCLIISLTVRFRHYKPILLTIFGIVLLINWSSQFFNSPILESIKMLTQNTIGGGVYMLTGMMLRSVGVSRNTLKYIALAGGVSLIIFHVDGPYWELLGGIGLFIFSLIIPIKAGTFFLNLRIQSMWIYYTHESILLIFFPILHILNYINNPWIILAMVFVTVLVLSKILRSLQNTRRFSWLGFLVK